MEQGTETTALALPVRSMEDIAVIGDAMAASGMFGLKNKAQGMVLAMTCLGEGMTPVAFKRKYHVHEDGTLSMRADAMAAGFRARGGRYTVREHSTTRAAALFEFGDSKIEAEFTLADAERHGYTRTKGGKDKDNWEKHAENMLWARLISENVRILTPEVCAGIYVPEEVDSFVGERQEVVVTPEEAAAKMPVARKERKAAAEPKAEAVEVKAKVVEDAKAETAVPLAKPARAAAAKSAEPTPFDPAPAEDEARADFSICPIPPFKGQPWHEMPENVLRHAAKTVHADLKDGHRDAIKEILKARAAAQKEA